MSVQPCQHDIILFRWFILHNHQLGAYILVACWGFLKRDSIMFACAMSRLSHAMHVSKTNNRMGPKVFLESHSNFCTYFYDVTRHLSICQHIFLNISSQLISMIFFQFILQKRRANSKRLWPHCEKNYDLSVLSSRLTGMLRSRLFIL